MGSCGVPCGCAPVVSCRLAVSWVVYAAYGHSRLAQGVAAPDGRGDVNGLLVATVAGALALLLLGAWLQMRERD